MNQFQAGTLTANMSERWPVGGADLAGGMLVFPVETRPRREYFRGGVAARVVCVSGIPVETFYGRHAKPGDRGGSGDSDGFPRRIAASGGGERGGRMRGGLPHVQVERLALDVLDVRHHYASRARRKGAAFQHLERECGVRDAAGDGDVFGGCRRGARREECGGEHRNHALYVAQRKYVHPSDFHQVAHSTKFRRRFQDRHPQSEEQFSKAAKKGGVQTSNRRPLYHTQSAA